MSDSKDDTPDVADEHSALGGIGRELTQRFQDLVNGMGKLGGSTAGGGHALFSQWQTFLESGAAMTSMPLRQIRLMADMIRVHRDQVHTLQEQLKLFEDQLTTFEQALRPLLEWGEQWQKAQGSMLSYLRLGKGSDH